MINIFIGLAVGVALMWFLVIPARTQNIRSELNKTTVDMGDQISAKTAQVEQLQKQLDEVQQQLDEAQQSAEDQNSGVDMYDKLLDAQSLSEEGKNVEARAVLSEINATVLSDKGKALYNSISATVDTEAFKELYASGQSSYDSGDYAAAVDSLKQIIDVDDTYDNGGALYLYARALHRSGDTDTASQMCQKVIDNYGGTKNATDSQRYLEEIQAQ